MPSGAETPPAGQSGMEIDMDTIPQGAIYLIQNTVSGGVYVGQTICKPARRWNEHKSALRHGRHGNPHLQFAWNKYEAYVFEFCVLETFATIEETNEAECFYLEYFRSIGVSLYNCSAGGLNGKKSPEAVAKMRAARMGYKASAETRARQSASLMGRKQSAESIAKSAANRRGYKQSNAAKAKMSAAWVGRVVSPETRAKQGATRKGRKKSADVIEKSRQWHVGSKRSEEAKAAMSAAQAVRYRKNYVFRSPDGAIVHALNITAFALEYGISRSGVANLVYGITKTHRGWSFEGIPP